MSKIVRVIIKEPLEKLNHLMNDVSTLYIKSIQQNKINIVIPMGKNIYHNGRLMVIRRGMLLPYGVIEFTVDDEKYRFDNNKNNNLGLYVATSDLSVVESMFSSLLTHIHTYSIEMDIIQSLIDKGLINYVYYDIDEVIDANYHGDRSTIVIRHILNDIVNRVFTLLTPDLIYQGKIVNGIWILTPTICPYTAYYKNIKISEG